MTAPGIAPASITASDTIVPYISAPVTSRVMPQPNANARLHAILLDSSLSMRHGDRWQRAIAELGVGGQFKDAMTEPGQWTIGATAFGEMLPNHDNMIGIDETRTDKWGLPVLRIDCATGENERLMRRDMINDMAETLEAAGVRNVSTYDNEYFPGMGIHEMGTARMGRDRRTSVLNSNNQVWDAPNVYVTDGSCMVSAACQNPSLTYMALTARAVDHAVNELNRQNL